MFRRIAFNPLFRTLAFWAIVAVVVWLFSYHPWLDFRQMGQTVSLATSGTFDALSDRRFAFSLATFLVALAAGFAVAYAIMYVLLIFGSLFIERRRVLKFVSLQDFARGYETVHQRLLGHPIIGHAWKEFDETLVQPHGDVSVISNTVRPQAFINTAVARERLPGMKMMPHLPNYFVGVGLLLTFIGLVLALEKAATGVGSEDAASMQTATTELLQVATFKFSTSIAGLGASIVLAILFRFYTIWIEGAFDEFCTTVESKLRYTAPQSIAAQMNETMSGQLQELKTINSEAFFARLGEAVSPFIQDAMDGAIYPLTERMSQAMDNIERSGKTGLDELVSKFGSAVQGGAGAELKQLGASLQAMQGALFEVQKGISGSGTEFSQKMSDAADNLNRLVREAGESMGRSAEISQGALREVVDALQETFENTSRRVDEELGRAAGGASAKIEQAMGRVLNRLEEQVSGIQTGLSNFQAGMGRHIEDSTRQASSVQEAVLGAVSAASVEAARALETGLNDSLARIRAEVERLALALGSAEQSFAAQARSVRETANQSRALAGAFSETAQGVRAATQPLLQSSTQVASASERMADTIAISVKALEDGQHAAHELTQSIVAQVKQLNQTWSSYESRFGKIDEDLGRAIEALGKETEKQLQNLGRYTVEVDGALGKAVAQLGSLVGDVSESAQDLSDAAGDLVAALKPRQLA